MQKPNPLSCKALFVFVTFASLLNIVPMLLFDVGGDMNFHLVLIDCFAGQFWQGDLYPRWCMAANSGLGAPVFLFYFPLPYYVAALLYPLKTAGLSLYHIYIISTFLATIVTGLTLTSWLSDITSKPRALLVSVLVLFMPYRMEAMLFRAGYAEIWCMALLPLFFKYVRRLDHGEKTASAKLAAIVALMLLTHVTLSIAAFIAGGIYVCMTSAYLGFRGMFFASLRCKLAGFWGIIIAAFYLVPGIYFRRFMLPPDQVQEPTPWANSYLSMDNLAHQGRVVAGDGLAMIVLLLLAAVMLWRSKRIEDAGLRREMKAWLGASLVAGLLLFPISTPLYDALRPWSGVVFPWRMQMVFMFATAFLLAVWMRYFIKPAKLKTWKADFGMLLALLVLLSYFMVGVREDNEELESNILSAHLIAEPEYQTLWQDSDHFSDDYFFDRLESQPEKAQIISGKGKVEVTRLHSGGIDFQTDSVKPVTVRLDHVYFPIWTARLDGKEKLELRPEQGSGQILVEISAGKHSVKLYSCLGSYSILFFFISILSVLAALACLWQLMRYKIACMALTKPRARASFRP